ncbi:glycosyltransferase family 2 protein [Geobacillus sp. E263]|uniref:glycosyltransferase family 2 protein n=1 Tax=Geobacillus sp. E263 TaxID=391290 RepID=UPI001179C1BF|nr:glycosyltransferase family 2 protein [Geobacillus sp. E263]
MPKISVIMPCYNEEKSIGKSIKSILNQSFTDFEFIIVDDCSTDNTVNVINSFKDERIKLIRKKENSGVAASLNLGLQNATGKYVARMDADDICERERLQVQYEYMENNEDVVIVGTWAYTINPITNSIRESRTPVSDSEIRRYMQKDSPFIHPSVLFRRIVNRSPVFYSELKGFEDYDLWIRLSKHGKMANIPKFLVTRYDANNFKTKNTWSGLGKVDVYKRRLYYQWQAVKAFGIFPQTPFYLLKTIISIILAKKEG